MTRTATAAWSASTSAAVVDEPAPSGDDVSGLNKLWVDATTKLPLREALTRADTGATYSSAFWSYDADDAARSDYPADFFSLARPAQVGDEQTVSMNGTESPSSVVDLQTSNSFVPLQLGNVFLLPDGKRFCLGGIDTVTMTFDQASMTSADADPDPILPGIDPGAPETFTSANYRQLDPGAPCRPGIGEIDTPDLNVVSVADGSDYAKGFVEQYVSEATSTDADPTSADYGLTGSISVLVGGTAATAHVIDLGSATSTMIVKTGATDAMITGPLDMSTAGDIAVALQP